MQSIQFPNNKKITAFLGALAFFLSAIEYMIPKPFPFMRLGLANLPILMAVDILPFPWFVLLALIKIVGMGIVSGSLFSYITLFSFAGTISSAFLMYGLRLLFRQSLSLLGISVIGATISNFVQLALAGLFIFGRGVFFVAPLFLGTGLVTSVLLGYFACRFENESIFFARLKEDANAR